MKLTTLILLGTLGTVALSSDALAHRGSYSGHHSGHHGGAHRHHEVYRGHRRHHHHRHSYRPGRVYRGHRHDHGRRPRHRDSWYGIHLFFGGH